MLAYDTGNEVLRFAFPLGGLVDPLPPAPGATGATGSTTGPSGTTV
jgi:hypothetical protein